MKIPVFVSSPTTLNSAQTASRRLVLRQLGRLGLEARALGKSDYPTDLPLREVFRLANHCSGGVILGFEQFHATAGTSKRGTGKKEKLTKPRSFPTPWNQLEAGILFSLGLPLLVFREEGISGGIFSPGVTEVFVHNMPAPSMRASEKQALSALFLKWQANVRTRYYGDEA